MVQTLTQHLEFFTGSAAAVAPPVLSSSSASDHSDSSEPEDNARVAPKALKLPTWTRPMTGAEKKILEKGVVKNRKKKQKGESGSDEEDLKVKLAEREKQKKNKKKDPSPPLAPGDKGKGKAKVYRLSDESDEDDSDGSAAEPKGDSKKRPRSKSRSLTPPEPMDDFSLQSFLTKYRYACSMRFRPFPLLFVLAQAFSRVFFPFLNDYEQSQRCAKSSSGRRIRRRFIK